MILLVSGYLQSSAEKNSFDKANGTTWADEGMHDAAQFNPSSAMSSIFHEVNGSTWVGTGMRDAAAQQGHKSSAPGM